MNYLLAIVFSSLFISEAISHGMDKPGPNGGFIQMPGPFHTEVVPDKDGSIHVYLLDIDFKNPMVDASSVNAEIRAGKKVSKLNCAVMGATHFHCLGDKTTLKTGKLYVTAKRTEYSGEAVYDLPLKLPDAAAPTEDHSKH